jgi:TusA-related sulfurtransferase
MISHDMTVGRLLDEHPELVEVLVRYHPHFTCLKKKLLRRVMGPRVTVAFAARVAGVPADDLVATLRRAVGEPAPHPALSPEGRGFQEPPEGRGTSDSPSPSQGEGGGEGQKPGALAAMTEARQIHLDVREDIRLGQEPFARIMAAIKTLGADQVLVLRAPFEPAPLYDVLGKRGFAHWSERRSDDDWSVWFYREPGARPAARSEGDRETPAVEPRARLLDVRGLEPPEPMVKILKALERLAPGDTLEVLHERRPMLLYPQLEDRGFVHDTVELERGVTRIRIRRGERAR